MYGTYEDICRSLEELSRLLERSGMWIIHGELYALLGQSLGFDLLCVPRETADPVRLVGFGQRFDDAATLGT